MKDLVGALGRSRDRLEEAVSTPFGPELRLARRGCRRVDPLDPVPVDHERALCDRHRGIHQTGFQRVLVWWIENPLDEPTPDLRRACIRARPDRLDVLGAGDSLVQDLVRPRSSRDELLRLRRVQGVGGRREQRRGHGRIPHREDDGDGPHGELGRLRTHETQHRAERGTQRPGERPHRVGKDLVREDAVEGQPDAVDVVDVGVSETARPGTRQAPPRRAVVRRADGESAKAGRGSPRATVSRPIAAATEGSPPRCRAGP